VSWFAASVQGTNVQPSKVCRSQRACRASVALLLHPPNSVVSNNFADIHWDQNEILCSITSQFQMWPKDHIFSSHKIRPSGVIPHRSPVLFSSYLPWRIRQLNEPSRSLSRICSVMLSMLNSPLFQWVIFAFNFMDYPTHCAIQLYLYSLCSIIGARDKNSDPDVMDGLRAKAKIAGDWYPSQST